MTGVDSHCRIVGESLAGERPVDEQTHASVAVLAERLERLKRSSSLVAGVTFSPHVQRLGQRAGVVAVG